MKKRKINTKGGFQCFYAPVIFIDSIDRKDENYNPKVFLKKYYFIEGMKFIVLILMKNIMIKNLLIYF